MRRRKRRRGGRGRLRGGRGRPAPARPAPPLLALTASAAGPGAAPHMLLGEGGRGPAAPSATRLRPPRASVNDSAGGGGAFPRGALRSHRGAGRYANEALWGRGASHQPVGPAGWQRRGASGPSCCLAKDLPPGNPSISSVILSALAFGKHLEAQPTLLAPAEVVVPRETRSGAAQPFWTRGPFP